MQAVYEKLFWGYPHIYSLLSFFICNNTKPPTLMGEGYIVINSYFLSIQRARCGPIGLSSQPITLSETRFVLT